MLESILTLALPAAFLEFSPAGFFGMVDNYTGNRQRVKCKLVVDVCDGWVKEVYFQTYRWMGTISYPPLTGA